MYLFPPSVVDPEQIEAWKKKPQNRCHVSTLLGLAEDDAQSQAQGPLKKPASGKRKSLSSGSADKPAV
jgi:hypothetical protein